MRGSRKVTLDKSLENSCFSNFIMHNSIYFFVHYELLFMSVRDILLTPQREMGGRLKERNVERDVLLKGLGSTIFTVVTGPRRAAKSFFTIHRLQDAGTPIVYINFDDERLIALKDNDELIAAIHSP